jgi:Icc-related predicted phosphoesterase
MRILVISDIHRSRNAVIKSAEIASREKIDLILVLGDVSHNDFEEAISLLEILAKVKKVFFIPGNMDSKKLLTWTKDDIVNIHCKVEAINNEQKILGFGGSSITPFNTSIEFKEEDIAVKLDESSKNLENKKFIFASHCPPRNTKIDKTNFEIHGGSTSIYKFIAQKKPDMTICGHIHEAFGMDYIGDTIIVNTGAAKDNRYAIIESDQYWKANLYNF